MILEETLNRLIRDIIDLILEQPGYTIKSNQKGAPRPRGPYASVDYLISESLGWEERKSEDNEGDPDLTEHLSGLRNITFSINFYRDSAINNARKVKLALARESIQNLFSQSKVGLVSRSEVRKLDEPFDDGWEHRSQFDLVLNIVDTDLEVVRSILTVDMVGEFEACGLFYNFNVEVP